MDNAPSTEKPANWLGDCTIRDVDDVPLVELAAQITKANQAAALLKALLPDTGVQARELCLNNNDPRLFVNITGLTPGSPPHEVTIGELVYLSALDKLEDIIEGDV